MLIIQWRLLRIWKIMGCNRFILGVAKWKQIVSNFNEIILDLVCDFNNVHWRCHRSKIIMWWLISKLIWWCRVKLVASLVTSSVVLSQVYEQGSKYRNISWYINTKRSIVIALAAFVTSTSPSGSFYTSQRSELVSVSGPIVQAWCFRPKEGLLLWFHCNNHI